MTLAPNDEIVATLSDTTNGTSVFSADQAIAEPNIVTVTNNDGPGSLREAIDFANNNPDTTITFQIPSAGPSTVVTIDVGSATPSAGPNTGKPLPTITQKTKIDGLSQGGPGYNGPPLVVIDGTSAGAVADGLLLQGSNSPVERVGDHQLRGGRRHPYRVERRHDHRQPDRHRRQAEPPKPG